MAAIDKTYLSDYSVYQDFIKWAKDTVYVCPNGIKIPVISYVMDFWTKEDMDECERPVLSSPSSLDYFLIKYCPFEFVQERMIDVYDEKYVDDIKKGISHFDTFIYPEIGRHFVIERDKNFLHKDYLWKLRSGRRPKFSIHVRYNGSSLWYNHSIKRFLLPNELGTCNSNTCYKTRSIKSLLRMIRSFKLPKNSILTVRGRYVGEDMIIKVK